MVDPVEILRTILLADPGVVAQVADRVAESLVPPTEVAYMPRKCIRIMVDSVAPCSMPVLNMRISFHCFGGEPGFKQAWEVAGAVYDCLKRSGVNMVTITGGDAFYYMANCTCVGRPVTEPVTAWPRVDSEWMFTFGEEVAP